MLNYLKRRDKYRDERGLEAIWEGCSFHFIHKMLGKSGSIEDRSATLRIGGQKRWATSAFNDELCLACGVGRRSSAHVLVRCKDKRMDHARKMWYREVSKRIYRIKNIDIRSAVEELWMRLRNNKGGEYGMCGVFQDRIVESLRRGRMEIYDGEERIIMNVLKKDWGGS